ncbi:matrix metalloproteinase-28 isoform X1 [Anguilla anguilla]|uniref:matrix metalloproteinase-28 isoform X1 n=1 Tax=Anguilla anguilla TaxID=7936 RepID=UPI0015AB33A4|nr:matrix metalloproteinase-28 isoform X1 [Anguilla anguilla]
MTGRVASLPGGNLWTLVLRLLPLLLVKATIGSPVSSIQPIENFAAEGFLEKYGYLHQEDHRHNEVEVSSALREFQWLSHLPVTGHLDGPTLQRMSAPRCGVKDAGGQQAWARRVNRVFLGGAAPGGQHRRSKRYTRPGEKWYKRHLTYRVVNWPRHLPKRQVELAVRTAFQLWSNVSALAFREVAGGPADIRLAFYAGEHNDGTGNAFDGPGGALAHAFFPCRGEAHFDMAERWTLDGFKGHNLFMVIAHEIGHTLGLEHSPARHALMSPYYKKLGKALVLSWDDITAVQQLYGKPPGGQVVQLPGQVFSSALQDLALAQGGKGDPDSALPLYCQGLFDAITVDQNGSVLVFRGGLFWTVSAQGDVGPAQPLRHRWPQLPLAIEAAAFSPVDRKFYFFKGRRMWRYSGDDLDPGFPKKNEDVGLPAHPDCAFFYAPLGHMVLFKGSRYFVLNLTTLRPEPYYPRGLADWKGVPRGANGALGWADGRLYFFRAQQFWRFDPGKVRVTGGGQWAHDLEWAGCQEPGGANDVL